MTKPTFHKENLQWLLKQSTEVKIAMLESHLDICRLLVNEVLEEEVTSFCGEKYSHQKPHDGRYSRSRIPSRFGAHWRASPDHSSAARF